MKLGLMSAALPDLSLDEFASWSKENGFEMLEIACWPPGKADRRYAGVTHIDVTDFSQDDADELEERIQIANVIKVRTVGHGWFSVSWLSWSPQQETRQYSHFYL